MRRLRYSRMLVLLGTMVILLGPITLSAGSDSADNTAIKNLMGENFVRMQNLLYYLITSHYKDVANEAGKIENHAVTLLKGEFGANVFKVPTQQFTLFAGRLKSASKNLAVVAAELAQHDQATGINGRLSMDYLRSVAAEHYGEMVTSCVLCHNQFRRHVVD